VAAIRLFPPDGDVVQPVLADEDDEDLVPIRQLARSAWHSESGGAPISWSGGHKLSVLAPGLGYSSPYGDSLEVEDLICPFLELPEDPAHLGENVADWVMGTESAVAAAMALEPLDPDSELSKEERKSWEGYLEEVTVDFKVDLPEDATLSLRENLVRRSDLYCRTRDGLRNPRSDDGLALYSALEVAVADGVIGGLTSGDWED
jgi:hypothetical protein